MTKLNAYELAAAEAIRDADGCGCQVGGELVFCNDPRLPASDRNEGCSCIDLGAIAARAVLELPR